MDNLLALLFDNNRLVNLPQIYQQFALLEAEHKQCMNVEVISATQMDEHQRAALEKQLSQRFHTEVQATYHIDSSLMGGVVVRAGNWVMDGSIKGKIARLNEDLLS